MLKSENFAEDAILVLLLLRQELIVSTQPEFWYRYLIYLQSACGDSASELACNDDFGDAANGEVQSEIIIDLEAGQELFLVVDTLRQ